MVCTALTTAGFAAFMVWMLPVCTLSFSGTGHVSCVCVENHRVSAVCCPAKEAQLSSESMAADLGLQSYKQHFEEAQARRAHLFPEKDTAKSFTHASISSIAM